MKRHRSTSKPFSLGLAVLLATCAVAPAARADDAREMVEARRQFQAGVNLLDDPDGAKYEEAYHAFKKAYELSKNPRVLGNIGFCALHLERDGEAVDAYTAYLRDAPDVEEGERAQIQKDLATLTSTAARVHVTAKHPGTSFVLVDTRVQTRGPAVENSYPFQGHELTIRVRPGRHTLRLKSGASESQPVEVTIEPATTVSPELTFAPPRANVVVTRERPSLAGPVVLATGGILGIGAGVTAGLLARSKRSEIAGQCPNDLCPSTYDLDAQRDKARSLGTIADVSFVAGGALLGGAALWYALSGGRSRSTVTASAGCTGQGCAVGFQRGF